jgi:hypothetical protein
MSWINTKIIRVKMRFNYRSKPKERWQIITTKRRKKTDPGTWANMYGETGSIILQPGRCR